MNSQQLTLTCGAHAAMFYLCTSNALASTQPSEWDFFDPLCDAPGCAEALARHFASSEYEQGKTWHFGPCTNEAVNNMLAECGCEATADGSFPLQDDFDLIEYAHDGGDIGFVWSLHYDDDTETLLILYYGSADESPTTFMFAMRAYRA